MSSNVPRDDDRGRVLPFPRRRTRVSPPKSSEPVEGVEKYAQSEPDDYRQRMINNGLAFAFIVLLAAAGVWLADSIADMRRNQDCVLSGRRNCAPVPAPPADPKK
jgi:hypothetical protein